MICALIRVRFLLAYLLSALAAVCTADANLLGHRVQTEPELLIRLAANEKLIDRMFLYCYVDINIYHDFEGENCSHMVSVLNGLSDSVGMGIINQNDKDLIRTLSELSFKQLN
jgi:hypothetical protein